MHVKLLLRQLSDYKLFPRYLADVLQMSGLGSDHLSFAVSVLWCYVRGFVLTARHVRIVSIIVSLPSLFLCSLAHLVSHLVLISLASPL